MERSGIDKLKKACIILPLVVAVIFNSSVAAIDRENNSKLSCGIDSYYVKDIYFITGTFAYCIKAQKMANIIARTKEMTAKGNVITIPEINIFGNDSKNNSILSLPKIFILFYTLK